VFNRVPLRFHLLFFCRAGVRSGLVQDRDGSGRFKSASWRCGFCGQGYSLSTVRHTFSDVLRTDLDYCGILELVSKSYNPLQSPATPAEVDYKAWSGAPTSAQLLAFGGFSVNGNNVEIQAWLNDVRDASLPPVIGKVYRGEATESQVRIFAHQFADESSEKLSGGLPGIASTQIAFVSNRSGNKEIWAMDYDGENQHALTQLHTISLTPRWSPDASRVAFTCYAQPGSSSVLTAQICVYSTAHKPPDFPGRVSRAPIHRLRGHPMARKLCSCPACWGIRKLFISDATGQRPKRLTFSNGANTSPSWNPKTASK